LLARECRHQSGNFYLVHKGSDERGPIFAAADMEKDLVE